ncbi:MAG: pitrilysin family protein [Mariprofundaceae bacterium]|nr:pitrilysin family protein [Mariprofundaceae bacterium]
MMKTLCMLCLSLCWINLAYAVPQVQQHTLKNGVHVLLIEAHHVPMLAMQLTMPAGSRFDAEGKGGSAALLSALLLDHTRKSNHVDWAAQLDDAAIRLSAGVDQDALTLSLTVLEEAVDEGVEAMAEALLSPGWQRKRFALLKDNALAAAHKAQEEAGTQAAQAVVELLFPQHPYGHVVGGSLTSLNKVKLKDLKRLYQQQVKPQGATLAVSGDITMAALIPLLEKVLGHWQGQPKIALADIPQAIASDVMQKNIIMQKHQSLLTWVRHGPSRHDKDYMASLVLNHILGGGGFGSRLMEEVREKRGLTYGVYSWFQPLETSGTYTIRLQTRADQANEAEQVIEAVLTELAAGKITADMLKKTQQNLSGGFAQRMDSNRERAGLLSMMGLYHRPLNYLQNWTQSVESVTLADVKRLAKLYLQPQSWKRIRVGPASVHKHEHKKGDV